MPAAVETAVFANTPAWHQLGTVLDTGGDKGLTVEVALSESGLDWEVKKVPAIGFGLDTTIGDYADFMQKVESGATLKYSDLQWAKGRYNVQRQTDGRILGTVGKTWEPVQNGDGFQILQDVIEQAGGRCWIEAAGSLEEGSRVWVLAHIDEGMQIAGEKYFSYLLFLNGHNGRTAVTAAAMDVRAVCANTVAWGVNEAEKAGRIVRVRHTTKAAERIKEAAGILEMRNKAAEELAQQGEWLVEHTMDEGAFEDFLAELMPCEAEEGTPAHTMITERQDMVRNIFNTASNLDPIRGTRWAAYNAVAEYSDHARNFTSDETKLKANFGLTAAPAKSRAMELLTA